MILERLIERGRTEGNKIAIRTSSDSWTYNRLLDAVSETYKRINSLRLEENEPIGVMFPNSVELIISLFACAMAEKPAVLFNSAYKPNEIRYHVENCGIRWVLSSPSMKEILVLAGGRDYAEFSKTISSFQFDTKLLCGFRKGDFACLLTSGTNGIPKAVVRTEEAMWNEIMARESSMGITSGEKLLIIPPIYHAYCFVSALASLCSGAQLTLMSGFIPADALHLIETHGITLLFAVPIMYHLLNQHMTLRNTDNKPSGKLSSLKRCFSGGAPVSPATTKAFKEFSGLDICFDYGSTEIAPICISSHAEGNVQSVGKPVSGIKIRVLDENREELPLGEIGEIAAKSNSTVNRYLYPDELNSISYKDGWYLTGDLGRVDEHGNICLTGRKSNIINVAGLKVDPVEVENIISQFPGVRDVVVVGVDSGFSGQIIKSFIVAEENIRSEDIIMFCKRNLADFKIPRAIEFIDEVPRNQTGKILRSKLVL